MENTHTKQTVDSYEAIALTGDGNDLTGSARIQIVVLNDFVVTVKTFGVPRSEFADLKGEVVERLKDAGYNIDHLNIQL